MSGISLDLINARGLDPEDWENLVLKVYRRLIKLTPKDTGFAAGNWEYSFDEETAHFENDTPYISYLEDGWSSQAPDGIIQVVVSELGAMVEDYDLGDPHT